MKLGLSTEPTATSKGSSGENPLLSMRWATRPDAVTAVKLWASANGKEFLIEPHTKGGSNFLMVCKERLKKMIVAVKVKMGAAAKTKEVKKVDDNVSCKAQIMLTKSSSGKFSSTPWSIQKKNTELGHKNCLGESKMTCREVVKSAVFQGVIAVNKMAPARELRATMKKEGVDMNASLAYVGRTSACVWLCFVRVCGVCGCGCGVIYVCGVWHVCDTCARLASLVGLWWTLVAVGVLYLGVQLFRVFSKPQPLDCVTHHLPPTPLPPTPRLFWYMPAAHFVQVAWVVPAFYRSRCEGGSSRCSSPNPHTHSLLSVLLPPPSSILHPPSSLLPPPSFLLLPLFPFLLLPCKEPLRPDHGGPHRRQRQGGVRSMVR